MTHQDYLQMALDARDSADCLKRKVGAVLVPRRGGAFIGRNGTPRTGPRCIDGGCYRCSNPDKYPSGKGYEVCSCIHAEMDAILAALDSGVRLAGATVYTTLQPCFDCMKHLLEVGVSSVYYIDELSLGDADVNTARGRLQEQFEGGVNQLRARRLARVA